MSVSIKRPVLNGRTPEENIAKIDTYLNNLATELEYALNHLDSTNFVEAPVNKQELEEEITELNYELISLINRK